MIKPGGLFVLRAQQPAADMARANPAGGCAVHPELRRLAIITKLWKRTTFGRLDIEPCSTAMDFQRIRNRMISILGIKKGL